LKLNGTDNININMAFPNTRRPPMGNPASSSSLIDLPEYIITTFLPGAQPFLARYPHLFRIFGAFLALWYFGPLARLQALWSRFSSLAIATVNVTSEEDLFGYMVTYLTERKTLKLDQRLNAISNPVQPILRPGRDMEESSRTRPRLATLRLQTTTLLHQAR
jgi:hypothetical protein